jgi:glycosyltransferase involved in cell wall biosynthesis
MTLNFLTGQAGFLREHGFEIHAISSPGADLHRFGEWESVPVHPVDMVRGHISPLRDLLALISLWRQLRLLEPDIVDAHTLKAGLLGMVAAWWAAVPVRIYHIHGVFETAKGHRRWLSRWSDRLACRLASQVLCVSRSVRRTVVEAGLCAANHAKVLLDGSINGVDAERQFNPSLVGYRARAATRYKYGISRDALVIGYVGRVVRDKGIGELVAAWSVLRDQFPTAHLLMVGPFEAHNPVLPAAERVLREDSRVHLTGMDWDTAPLYAAMDVIALPTYREGFPTVVLEAGAMGLPVVATRVTGCVDAVEDGITGTLVPPGDASALSRALSVYLRDRSLRDAHGGAGRNRVLRRFRPAAMHAALLQEYTALLTTRAEGRD